ncbi:hypothetical protein L596_009668 [Steinernema carpocapsae]|uniref:Uncharacterized protein n=2 Tax=Steinernema carpocapsae TaxID=34508 RepID=A0A4U5PHB4_STECR|nr:hypothetical protein L596_009668 [Steinernema carpocapsae]
MIGKASDSASLPSSALAIIKLLLENSRMASAKGYANSGLNSGPPLKADAQNGKNSQDSSIRNGISIATRNRGKHGALKYPSDGKQSNVLRQGKPMALLALNKRSEHQN